MELKIDLLSKQNQGKEMGVIKCENSEVIKNEKNEK